MRSPSDQPPALTNRTPPAADSDYDSIHAAVMETVRGRWFLSEYARRNRQADTDVLLRAIGRIESFVEEQVRHHAPEPVPSENNDNRPALSDDAPATEPFFVPKDKLEGANADLVLVREHIRNITDSLIECGAPSFLTNDLKRRLGDIARICTDLGEIAKVAQPAPDEVVVATDESASVQEHLVEEAPETEAFAQPNDASDVLVSKPEPQPQRDPFADIRALSDVEKIALFT
ncbi:hypothetical protein [Pseudorhodoplanes sinuspersici]|uniref:hypothetical protein n=1 Tax=Pseudorhodoplanes sinuspersici TaxID=1235591 RepID=UPI000FF18D86|nr:hypothetical protein [Pseudorhodoplanes sinuspersici]RKE72354.1 hypothetical protein DFP91_0218 [Pseudorhodoplanes sinuspersici]